MLLPPLGTLLGSCFTPSTAHTHTHTHSSVQFSRSVMPESLQPHEPQQTRPPCPSPPPRVYSNSWPSSR